MSTSRALRFVGLYTKQKQKKHPTWHDCVVEIVHDEVAGNKLVLYAEPPSSRVLDSVLITSAELRRLEAEGYSSTETETEKYKVQIEESLSGVLAVKRDCAAAAPRPRKRVGRVMLRAAKKPKALDGASAPSLNWVAIEAETRRFVAATSDAAETLTQRMVRSAIEQRLGLADAALKVDKVVKARFKALVVSALTDTGVLSNAPRQAERSATPPRPAAPITALPAAPSAAPSTAASPPLAEQPAKLGFATRAPRSRDELAAILDSCGPGRGGGACACVAGACY
jgi:hypothetical protein